MMWNHRVGSALVASCLLATTAAAQPGPNLVQESDLQVRAKHVGTMPFVLGPGFFGDAPNLGSPVPIKNKLFLIDQNDAIYRWNGKKVDKIFGVEEAPDGLVLDNRQSILNVSEGKKGNRIYVAFTSATLPTVAIPVYGLPAPLPDVCCDVLAPIPVPDLYRLGAFAGTRTEYQVFYEFKVSGKSLKSPRAIAALETQSGPTHNGGGMLTLPDGRILFASGDALPFGAEGRAGAQDPNEIVSKLLIIDPDDGSVEVVASGLRNAQHLEYVDGKKKKKDLVVSFADIGGVTAEEVNYVPLADLLDGSEIENFGWGRNADGLAREGTFYVAPGVPLITGTQPPVDSAAPSPEPGFIQPQAQYGRNDPNGGVAVSGPVTSKKSFKEISALFSDLSSGLVYATTADLDEIDAPVLRVGLVDENGIELNAFQDLAGVFRGDPRFFRFPNGKAGVLLEATGDFYELSEVRDGRGDDDSDDEDSDDEDSDD